MWSFGSALSTALEEASQSGGKNQNEQQKKRKRQQVLAKWLPDVKADTPRLRDPGKESPDAIIKRG